MTLKKLLIGIGTLLLVGGIGSAGLALYIFWYGQADRATASDVIIVLGAGTRNDGTANRALARRVRHGVTLYQRGLAPYLLCTGGYTNGHPKSEAEVCADLAAKLGVPQNMILQDRTSTNTLENVIESRKLMQPLNLKTAVVVSDNFHLFRAEWLFNEFGIKTYLSPAQSTQGRLTYTNAALGTVRELGALAINFYRVNFQPN